MLSQAALAYYRSQLAEQGRNILDRVLRSYPKRLDLWNLYIDQVLRLGSILLETWGQERCCCCCCLDDLMLG